MKKADILSMKLRGPQLGFILLYLFAFIMPLPCATFTVVVVEQNIISEAPIQEASSAWESGIMDCLFDQGHIFSNYPIGRNFTSAVIEEAKEGGADYLYLSILDYGNQTNNITLSGFSHGKSIPLGAEIRLIRVNGGELVNEIQQNIVGKIKTTLELEDLAMEKTRTVLSLIKDR